MTEHDFLSMHAAKAVEYLIAIAYLLLFIPFWRYVQGTTRVRVAVPAGEPERLGVASWFHVPDGVFLHPGHAWAQPSGAAAVRVGLDDFGHRLIGPLDAVQLPKPRTTLKKGERAFTLLADGRPLDVRSPVDGLVVAVNEAAATRPAELGKDPYGAGWLLSVAPKGWAQGLKELLAGDAARRFVDAAAETLAGRLTPQLGALAQDGGTPVHGIAREVDPEHWDELVGSFLMTR